MTKYFPLVLSMLAVGPARALEPLSAPAKLPAKVVKPLVVTEPLVLDAFDPGRATSWSYDNVPQEQMAGSHTLLKVEGRNTLQIHTAKFVPAVSTLRVILPGDQNGDLWNKSKATYISFYSRSDRPVDMSIHLLKKGKTPGTYQAGFLATSGAWQRFVVPIERFNLRNFSGVVGLAFRLAAPSLPAKVEVAGVTVGAMPYNDDAWKTHRLQIPLKGTWSFSAETEGGGTAAGWHQGSFADAQWKELDSDSPWSGQGVMHNGWGWYRQKLVVPKEFSGTPLTLALMENPSDDEVYFNGTRIGGWSGEYKYQTQIQRQYSVPPELVRYGQENSIAIKVWGGNLSFIGEKSRSLKGDMLAILDPYRLAMRANSQAREVAAELFDFTETQQGKEFEILLHFPAELAQPETTVRYNLTDFTGKSLASGQTPLAAENGTARAIVNVDKPLSQRIYLAGRIKVEMTLFKGETPIYSGTRVLDRPSYAARDALTLPTLTVTLEDTPYGKLKLVDEINAAQDVSTDPHPYMQSGFDSIQKFETAGSDVRVEVKEILGKPARESEYGWFAYRLGRGKLKPHTNYLVRIEYPEDKARYSPVEFQVGQNFVDVGWKNGLGPEDPYEPWPLSKKWQWYDTVISLDDEATGTGGVGTTRAENGFWVYFMNKNKPGVYHALYEGGPAIARIKLYEIDPAVHAPSVTLPSNLPQRTLMLDWERQPDGDPEDFVRYARLMGYNAISPVIIKWGHANYSEPIPGYNSVNVDAQNYWVTERFDATNGKPAGAPVPGRPSIHVRYLEATRKYGMQYLPRFEYGGSYTLPEEARAIGTDGKLAKPNRFDTYGANLLHEATFADLKLLLDQLIKPYVKDNPQLVGALWRIRSDRMPISYGPQDLALFARESGTALPPGGYEQQVAWATGEMKGAYDTWWHGKRARFHARVVELLRSYRADLKLQYYNWDGDKFGLILPDTTAWGFIQDAVKPGPEGGAAAYRKDRELRKEFTAADYIEVLRTGNFGKASYGINRADYGLRPSLYQDVAGMELFAPANYYTYAEKADYLNYFRSREGVAVSNVVSYDELAARYIHPKYEGNMLTPAGPAYSMAIELLAWFHADARTLSYTSYTFGRGFADAHRKFARAFLALPALNGDVVAGTPADIRARTYTTAGGTYVGVANKGFVNQPLTLTIPGKFAATAKVLDLVSGGEIPAQTVPGGIQVKLDCPSMELGALLVK